MKSLETAIQVLRAFATNAFTLSVAEVAATTGFNRSHVSKILSAFRDGGLLKQNPVTRRYSIGVDLYELGVRYVNGHQIARDALPIMRQLVDSSCHSATLSIRNGDHALHLLAVEGPLYLESRWRAGMRLPIHTTAAGQILLAWLGKDDLEQLLGRISSASIGPITGTDRKRLLKALEQIRVREVCVTRRQNASSITAIAVPVFDELNKVSAALGLIIPDHLFARMNSTKLQRSLIDAARVLSLKMAASTYSSEGSETVKLRHSMW